MKRFIPLCLGCVVSLGINAQTHLKGELTEARAVTSDTDNKYENPRWSPDGTKVAFTKFGYDGLYVIDKEGTGKRCLSEAAGVGYRYQWGIDSEEILVRDTRVPSEAEMPVRTHAYWMIDMSGAKVRLSDDAADLQPAIISYTPEGKRRLVAPALAATPDADGPKRVKNLQTVAELTPEYRFNVVTDAENLFLVDGNGNCRLLYAGCALVPALSPDGSMVAFVTERDEIMTVNADGSGLTKHTTGFSPCWNGNDQIIFERTEDDGHTYTAGDLYLLTLSSGEEVRLTQTPDRIEMNAALSPDGKRIAFTDYARGQLFIANIR